MQEHKEIRFNINKNVKVKLTPFGEQILKDKHEALVRKLRRQAENPNIDFPFNIKVDENGYYQDQLWSLMKNFGEYIGLTKPQPFETEIILINDKNL